MRKLLSWTLAQGILESLVQLDLTPDYAALQRVQLHEFIYCTSLMSVNLKEYYSKLAVHLWTTSEMSTPM